MGESKGANSDFDPIRAFYWFFEARLLLLALGYDQLACLGVDRGACGYSVCDLFEPSCVSQVSCYDVERAGAHAWSSVCGLASERMVPVRLTCRSDMFGPIRR